MTVETAYLDRLLAHFGRSLHTALKLEHGVCGLYDQRGQEAAVIELPPQSDSFIMHCLLFRLAPPQSDGICRGLLALNFEMNAMRGGWIALDQENGVRLCTQQKLAALDETGFTHLLTGFIQQVKEVRHFVMEQVAEKTTPTDSRSLARVSPMNRA
ncbi:type III secretion system chaperone [Sodalis sp. dw_96]|uniref:type III secretion system chaperone n=1 Tax=Sodalis sp. dw_96 TaxID=2719794 RepID=UPI001BD535FE|nr:type III secretion system chaperone [Sodalis sp. dw_96]